jgi:hypothetical protein
MSIKNTLLLTEYHVVAVLLLGKTLIFNTVFMLSVDKMLFLQIFNEADYAQKQVYSL